ncbi:hypothetical protein HPP92_007273, partial [Vanilla planifolia]
SSGAKVKPPSRKLKPPSRSVYGLAEPLVPLLPCALILGYGFMLFHGCLRRWPGNGCEVSHGRAWRPWDINGEGVVERRMSIGYGMGLRGGCFNVARGLLRILMAICPAIGVSLLDQYN